MMIMIVMTLMIVIDDDGEDRSFTCLTLLRQCLRVCSVYSPLKAFDLYIFREFTFNHTSHEKCVAVPATLH